MKILVDKGILYCQVRYEISGIRARNSLEVAYYMPIQDSSVTGQDFQYTLLGNEQE